MDSKFLPLFAGWLRSIGEDVSSLAHLVEAEDAPEPIRLVGVESLQCLLRAADLIPEGLEALGYLEVAFTLRSLAARALSEHPELAELGERAEADAGRVLRLAADGALVAEFLGDELPVFQEIALAPATSTRAGRSASDVARDDELRAALVGEAREWVELYRAPELAEGSEELVKIGAFFRTRLRRAS